MSIEEIIRHMKDGKLPELTAYLNTHKVVKGVDDAFKQIDPKKHRITDKSIRKDKVVYAEESHNDGTTSKRAIDTVPVARLPLAIQKKIVSTATAFLGIPKVEATATPGQDQNFLDIFKKIWDDNKFDYKFRKLVKTTKSLKECAVIIYEQPAQPGYWDGFEIKSDKKFRLRLLSRETGDTLLPIFDEFGDMIAFGRGYKIVGIDGNEIEYMDIYTAGAFYFARNVSGVWQFSGDAGATYSQGFKVGYANSLGKIPIIYFSQPLTEWEDVQELIDALETIISDHNDTNKYNGNPIIFAEGDVEGFADKGETGKLLIGKNGAKVSYLTWNNAPESIKMEIENLLKFIHYLTHTPDISFEQLKGLGYFSTVALQTLFMDPHIKAQDSEDIFGEGTQRLINYMKAAIVSIDARYVSSLKLEMKPVFTYFLPRNNEEIVGILAKAVSAGLTSQATAVNELHEDGEAELERIKGEQAEADAREAAKVAKQTPPIV